MAYEVTPTQFSEEALQMLNMLRSMRAEANLKTF
jgi:hypothetical protein